jgi:nitrogen PTS system EIIA component
MNKTTLFYGMIDRGYVYYNIKGSTPAEVLASLVKVARTPKSIDKKTLKEALAERESIATTAIGKGFAIPHPRHHLAAEEKDAMVVIAYLDTPLDWGALDGKPVSTLFLVLSADVQNHLSVLSAIACLAGKEEFGKMIAKQPSKKEFLEYLSGLGC